MSVGADSNDSGAFLYGIFAAAIWQRRGNLMLLVGLCLIPCQSEAQSRSVPAPPPSGRLQSLWASCTFIDSNTNAGCCWFHLPTPFISAL